MSFWSPICDEFDLNRMERELEYHEAEKSYHDERISKIKESIKILEDRIEARAKSFYIMGCRK